MAGHQPPRASVDAKFAAEPEPEPDPEERAPDSLMLPEAPVEQAMSLSGRKLLESLPFFQVEPAPFDPRVPPLPGEEDVPVAEEPATTSGLFDIRSMLALEATVQKQGRTDDDLLNLSGGLFHGAGAAGPIVPPDMHALTSPAPPSRPIPLAPASSPSRPSTLLAPVLTPSSASSPLSERRASTKELASAQRSARLGWIVAVIAGSAALIMFGLKLGQSMGPGGNAGATPTPPGSAAPVTPTTAAPEATTRPAIKRDTEPTVDDTQGAAKPADPGSSDKSSASASAQASAQASARPLGTAWPKGSPTATGAPTGAATAPPVATAVVTAPPVDLTPPPPAGGPEFSVSAAKAALAIAAASASGCKKPDDPSGSAKVSITFAPSGRVTSARVSGSPFQGTPTGGCIASAFRSASVPAFDGSPVTVTKDVAIR